MAKWLKITLISCGSLLGLILACRALEYHYSGAIMSFPGYVVCQGRRYACEWNTDAELQFCSCEHPDNRSATHRKEMKANIESPTLTFIAKIVNPLVR